MRAGRSPRAGLACVLAALAAACSGESPAGLVSPPAAPPAPPAASLSVAAGDGQVGPPGARLGMAPSVRVSGSEGQGVAGVAVRFTVVSGGGTVSSPTATTDPGGRASAGAWTLGDEEGTQELEASVQGVGSVTFRATATAAAGPAGGSAFDIEIRFVAGSTPTGAQQNAFDVAENRWEQVVSGDLPSVAVDRPRGTCSSSAPLVEAIDDLVIFVTLEAIDGPGGVLGSAGPCMLRSGSRLPLVGRMRFDTADLAALEANGLLGQVILHELGHVLGVGTLWTTMSLLADAAGSGGLDPHFTGSAAIAAFDAIGGSGHGGHKVPVEDTGGAGTRDAHWREGVFDREIMTGWVDAGSNALSLVTIQSLADLGYEVDTGEAQSVGLTISPSFVPRGEPGPGLRLADDVWRGPFEVVDASGRPEASLPR